MTRWTGADADVVSLFEKYLDACLLAETCGERAGGDDGGEGDAGEKAFALIVEGSMDVEVDGHIEGVAK